jgi:outer membrane lipoprotein-sorting protein
MRTFIAILALLLALPAATPARAAAAGVAAADAPSVRAAEAYLRNLTTARARFLQTAPDGKQAIGTFYLNRPGKLRFEYDPPVRDFVVADGFFIYFYDAALGEQSNAPIGQTLADFLLRPDLTFSGDIRVAEVRRSGGLLLIKLVQSKDEAAGALTLGFEEQPLRLKKWRVTDATNAVVEVELFKLEEGVKLPDSLFVYAQPIEDRKKYND